MLLGPGFIHDVLLGAKFKISPRSFYQINPCQTARLYSKALELADIRPGDNILDAYCGIGTIGICAVLKSEGCLLTWGVALLEYFFMVPANKIGSSINGGPFSLMQLKIIQECISLTVFTLICALVFKSQPIEWNHFAAFGCIIAAVFFCFLK